MHFDCPTGYNGTHAVRKGTHPALQGDRRRGRSRLAGHADAAADHDGRKSGEPRELPLIYGRSGDDLLIVASKGGADQPPAWYVNLKADPEVEVQVKGDRFKAHARDATPDEKPEMWKTMTAEWPAYDDYQSKTEREIPVIVLEREE